jgi:preprotein translocase subunit SecA
MIGTIMKKVFGTANERELKRIQVLVDEINALESGIAGLADADLKAKTEDRGDEDR